MSETELSDEYDIESKKKALIIVRDAFEACEKQRVSAVVAVGAWQCGPGVGLKLSSYVSPLLPSLDALWPPHECHHYACSVGGGVLCGDLTDWLMDAHTKQGSTATTLGQHNTDLSR